ncbi:hypothetical protein IWZ03DRAFT_235446 [Phyllosticta citriasiana]|uniref:Secreted protein n=1 Tax=Phyllosticta citriasiana TaxID=595635 RepID=A0ABR1KGS1_9PEZI
MGMMTSTRAFFLLSPPPAVFLLPGAFDLENINQPTNQPTTLRMWLVGTYLGYRPQPCTLSATLLSWDKWMDGWMERDFSSSSSSSTFRAPSPRCTLVSFLE